MIIDAIKLLDAFAVGVDNKGPYCLRLNAPISNLPIWYEFTETGFEVMDKTKALFLETLFQGNEGKNEN